MKYFKEYEFLCNCGCGMSVSMELKNKLDKARGLAQAPFRLNSAARCLEHNRKIGSKDTSSHVKGLAVDIAYTSHIQLAKIIYGLTKVGFNRIGVNEAKSFVHADIDNDKPNALFSY
jgi:uncharacterized protein YcbK (DUF882 family)